MLPFCLQQLAFTRDFILQRPALAEYVRRLREWRDAFVSMIAERPVEVPLESYSYYLTEFEHQRFDDVEVPGQYLLVVIFILVNEVST